MKKNYIKLLLLSLFVAFSANAQTDNMETYAVGDISNQSAHWRTWSSVAGGAEDGDVVNDNFNSGAQSMNIDGSGITDQLLIFLDQPVAGIYYAQWHMYIPTGSGGYFNMQGAMTPDGTAWNQHLNGGNVYFNQDGIAAGVGAVDGTPGQAFTYPEDAWFKLLLTYDLDSLTWSMAIDGVEQFAGQEFTFNDAFEVLAAIDFFSVDSNNFYYIDDVILSTTLPGASVSDLESLGFTSYPNPVQDELTLKAQENITNVVVYNIIGQEVRNISPNALETNINMSDLNSGAYFVKVSIGDTVGTIKILK